VHIVAAFLSAAQFLEDRINDSFELRSDRRRDQGEDLQLVH
jgi:hypothetical protein